MSTRQKKKKQRDGAVKGFVFSSVSFIVICAALAFGMSVFFRVSNIEVVGAARYTKDEIIAASGIKDGDNLMLLNRESAAERIYSKLIYIGAVKVSRKIPNTVVITVSESGAAAVIESESGLWLVDSNCRVLEECSTQDAESYVKVKGLSAVKPQKGDTVSVADEDKPKLSFLIDILTAMAAKDMTGDVGSLDMSNVVNAQFDYLDGRFTVKLGTDDNVEYKLGLLLGVIQELDDDDTGTIDLSQDKKVQFDPF